MVQRNRTTDNGKVLAGAQRRAEAESKSCRRAGEDSRRCYEQAPCDIKGVAKKAVRERDRDIETKRVSHGIGAVVCLKKHLEPGGPEGRRLLDDIGAGQILRNVGNVLSAR